VDKIDLKGILDLSVEDRIELVQRIWESVAADPDALPLTDDQRMELERRLAEHEKNPEDVVDWEVAEARIRSQLKK